MNYEEFVCAMLECTKKKLSSNQTVEKQSILKNNGVTMQGLVIRTNQEKVAPLIYLEYFYEKYLEGESIERLSELLLERSKMAEPRILWNDQMFFDFNGMKEQVICRLVNAQRNASVLMEVPHILVMDLAVVFNLNVPVSEQEQGSILIRKEHLKLWEVSEEVLYEISLENMMKNYPVVLSPLAEFIPPFLSDNETKDSILVLTNEFGSYGAATVLYPGMMKKIYERVGNDYYLLPASVHEFIIVPENYGLGIDELTSMVREINATQIPAEEFLSDDIYYFDGTNVTKM